MATSLGVATALDLTGNEVLTLIEAAEAGLLNWGFLEPRSELDATLPVLLDQLPSPARDRWLAEQAAGATPRHLINNLLERKLLFESGGRYRTRFAEAIRLLFLLRQRFSEDDWQTAGRLVSDLRIHLQRRRYPKREVEVSAVLAQLKDLGVDDFRLVAIEHLASDESGTPLRLAQFQATAILQQIRNLRQTRDRALVIGAGTGAGKTKAFYIPAMAEIAATLTAAHRVRAIAIYPRVELLKDQLAEAFSEARKLDGTLAQRSRRPIAIGAYYGDTPESAADFLKRPPENWRQTDQRDGWICPFFFCPHCVGERNLVWARKDLQQEATLNARGSFGKFERLSCPTCGFEAEGDRLRLTRAHLLHAPPDLLFTTTEMLNRRLSRAGEHALFGIGVSAPPRLLLLDEIHTYEGLTGAQVAYLIRRWRHARGAPPHHSLCVVGLSATLADAETFFAKLTGIPSHHVNYITPTEAELVEEGAEYNVVVKGDPVSGTSLLSTSVQTVMLLARLLDPDVGASGSARETVSRGALGRKLFAFTDKLDVINRWFHIEQDAETRQVLSQFRDLPRTFSPTQLDRRNRMGQDWEICKRIGHDLYQPLRLGLTSSQSRGVRANADLVIATSTLEVGFNDPAVGGVVQHKAPRSLASFLQRKGRAGRTRTMRPWMVVVTSAYGRDRWTFQHAEDLFSPVVPPIDLPLENVYVRKIQASYALMDWLALTLKKRGIAADVWSALSSADRGKNRQRQEQRTQLRNLLLEVLSGDALDELATYLTGALGFGDGEQDGVIQQLLWGEPRSLLYHVIPTILRQVDTDWQRVERGVLHSWSDTISSNPMPDFVPSSLFTDLNLPELLLRIPQQATRAKVPGRGQAARSSRMAASAAVRPTGKGAPTATAPVANRDETMALAAGMTEFAPGNVTKRYARSDVTTEAHWLEPPDEAQLSRGKLPLQYLYVDSDELPHTVVVDGLEYRVFRPRAYSLATVPQSVKSTSTARLLWRSHFAPQSQRRAQTADPLASETLGAELALSPSSPWRATFPNVRCYSQAAGAWVEATRLATGVRLETRMTNGTDRRRTLFFEEGSAPAALGFTSAVDALRFTFAPLDVEQLLSSPAWPRLRHHLGPEYFLHRLRTDRRLAEANLSSFEIGWLWQLELSMLVATAVARQETLGEAAEEVDANRHRLADRTMRVIFQSQQGDDDSDELRTGRLHQRLLEYSARPEVREALRDAAAVLWNAPDDGLADWLRQCYASSLGSALFAAVAQLVPDVDPDDLLLDVEGEDIWITEAAAGGVGLIGRIADAIAQRPREFDLQLRDTLEHCDREQLAIHLHGVADQVHDADLQMAFARVRSGGDLPQQQQTRLALARTLEQQGIPATREVVVSLNAKFFRPNSGPDTDGLLAELVRRWDEEEARLGCAIDIRVMAVAARQIPAVEERVQQVLRRIGAGDEPLDENQIFNVLQSMLWLSCTDSCPDCIERPQPYQELARPSRALLLALLHADTPPIPYGTPDWEDRCREQASTQFRTRIACAQEDLAACKETLQHLVTTGVEIGYQFFYPIVERVERTGRAWVIELTVHELAGS